MISKLTDNKWTKAKFSASATVNKRKIGVEPWGHDGLRSRSVCTWEPWAADKWCSVGGCLAEYCPAQWCCGDPFLQGKKLLTPEPHSFGTPVRWSALRRISRVYRVWYLTFLLTILV